VKIIIVIILALQLSACSAIDIVAKTWEVIKDPSIPVGEPKDRLTVINISMKTDSAVNPNAFADVNVDQENVKLVDRLQSSSSDQGELLVNDATTDVNDGDQATPISFKVLQLKDDSFLLQADIENLFDDMKAALGTSYVTHDDYMMVPDEYKFIEDIEIEEDTRFIGVAAAYHDHANAVWKQVVKINPKGERVALFIYFDETSVELKTQEAFQ